MSSSSSNTKTEKHHHQECPSATNFLEDPALMSPFTHVANLPSKNIRGYFVDAIAKNLLQLPKESVARLQEATATLHSASLLFDDIEDGTNMRRGEPAAHVIFGMPLSLNAASAATCAALEIMLKKDGGEEMNTSIRNFKTAKPKQIIENQEAQNDDENDDEKDNDDGEEMSSESNLNKLMTMNNNNFNERQNSQIDPASSISASFNERYCGKNFTSGDDVDEEIEEDDEDLEHAALSGRLTRVYLDNMKLLHSGQGKDIYWRDIHQCPTLPEYRLMARQKTGGLFRLVAMWALELESFNATKKNESTSKSTTSNNVSSTTTKMMIRRRNSLLLSLCDDFGLCFQILDDVANLCDEKLHAMKSFADDIDEGKFSYPAIHCILEGEKKIPMDKRLLIALCRKSSAPSSVEMEKGSPSSLYAVANFLRKSDAEKEFCLNLMKDAGSIKASCDEVLSLCDLLKKRLDEMIAITSGHSSSSGMEKCKLILMTLIERMSERAREFSK